MISKREPKHMGEVMSDIAERYNKLTKTKMSKVIVPNLKFDPNEFELEGEIVDDVKQKCLDGSIFEYYLVKTKYGINKYIKEEFIPKQRR